MPGLPAVRACFAAAAAAAAVTLAACGGENASGVLERGSLRVVVEGAGSPLDPDGVRVTLDGGRARTVEIGGSTTFENVTPEGHVLGVSEISSDCSAERGPFGLVGVEPGATSTETIQILCGDAQTILFWSERGTAGGSGIWSVRPDGTNLRRLAGGQGARRTAPSWAPDRTRFVHVREEEGEAPSLEIEALGVSSPGSVTVLSADPSSTLRDPTWSPVAELIAYSLDGDLWLVGPDSSPRRIQEAATEPAWSPDGGRIVFVRELGDQSDLVVVDADGSDPVLLTDTPGRVERSPAWAPDGSRIVYRAREGETYELRAIAPDGTGDAGLTSFAAGGVAFSPSGAFLATTRVETDGSTALATLGSDGTSLTILFSDGSPLGDPAW